jgi:endonuclease YncB( thermonuclease family)
VACAGQCARNPPLSSYADDSPPADIRIGRSKTCAYRYPMFFALVLMLLALSFPSFALAQAVVIGHASVIDGDTIDIHGMRVRLCGIDAPGSGQWCNGPGALYPCGQKAAFALADKIQRKPVRCLQRDTDRFERMVAVCWAASEDLNGWMFLQGQAIAYRKYSRDYVTVHEDAHHNKRGLWQGDFERPDVFRHRKEAQGATLPPIRPICVCVRLIWIALAGCGARSVFARVGGINPRMLRWSPYLVFGCGHPSLSATGEKSTVIHRPGKSPPPAQP